MKKHRFRIFFLFIALPLLIGALSAFLSREGMTDFELLRKPSLAPPGWVFPVVWTLLYLLMGISAALVWLSGSSERGGAVFLWGAQLFVNFWWSIFFFRWQIRGYALLWLLLLFVLAAWMTLSFRRIRPAAGRINYPYLIWLALAVWLNAAVWFLNA